MGGVRPDNKGAPVPTSEFRAPHKIVFGVGALESLGKEVRAISAPASNAGAHPTQEPPTRTLLVTGRRAMAAAGITARTLKILAAAGARAALFDEVEPEPDIATVDRCRMAARQHAAQVVIGLGGGSAIDVAKAAAALVHADEPTRDFHQGKPISTPGLPIIAIPSTAGTGSEMTSNSVLTDAARQWKASLRGESLVPAVALIDPEITLGASPFVTAASGMDALVQAVESYLSRHATPLTEAISLRAAEEMARALPAVVTRGNDIALRTHAAWGSAMAGMALASARLGIVHGIAHPVGVRFNVPHGLVCGVLLPAALAFNYEAAPEKYGVLRQLFGGDPIDYARRLLAECGLPARLTAYNLRADSFDAIAAEALASGSTKANPRTPTKEDICEMLRKIA
jgi:alcohol dehydrogenase class IV